MGIVSWLMGLTRGGRRTPEGAMDVVSRMLRDRQSRADFLVNLDHEDLPDGAALPAEFRIKVKVTEHHPSLDEPVLAYPRSLQPKDRGGPLSGGFPHMFTTLAVLLAAAVGGTLSGCSSTPTPAQVTAGAQAVLTLGALAAQTNTTADKFVAQGALFCQSPAGSALPAVFVLANLAGAPVAVTGAASTAVAAACALFQAIPTTPPANAAAVPVVVAPVTTLPAVH